MKKNYSNPQQFLNLINLQHQLSHSVKFNLLNRFHLSKFPYCKTSCSIVSMFALVNQQLSRTSNILQSQSSKKTLYQNLEMQIDLNQTPFRKKILIFLSQSIFCIQIFSYKMNLKMKINKNPSKNNEKPIKYKEFIQQLHNSSRSSINDQSMLSQRSFRQSNTMRDNQELSKKQNIIKCHQSNNDKIQKIHKNQYAISKPNINLSQQNTLEPKANKLYTFCDAKLTQKSIQFQGQNIKNQIFPPIQPFNRSQLNDKKYFKPNKHKNEHKQNINFVNKIIQKVEAGFQGKILKTQAEVVQILQNLQTRKNSIEKLQIMNQVKMINSVTKNSQTSSCRKIQSVKKIFVMAKNSNNPLNKNKRSQRNSEQKSRQSSLNKNKQNSSKQQNRMDSQIKQKVATPQYSSKKKIVSLNINSLKAINQNKAKIKLSLDKSYQSKNSSIYESKTSLIQPRNLTSSLQKMSSLQQSKISSFNHESSKNNLLLSGTQLKELTGLLNKQKNDKDQQNYKLSRIIEQQRERQKRLRIEIQQLNEKLKQSFKLDEKKELEILRRDCSRLTNSYKQIKRLYEMTIKQKEQIQLTNENINNQNFDLKQCLKFKKIQVLNLQSNIQKLQQHIYRLQQQLSRNKFPAQLTGLSEMIKQKMSQYQIQIDNLNDQNQRLILIRQKLQNYNTTLKQQIQEKDNLIWQLQRQQKETSQMRRSCRDQVMDHRFNQNKLSKIVKELQSKLKLANIHNQYLTKELLYLKNQKKNSTITGSSPMLVKFGSSNTLANTITTRNSSISHGNIGTHARQKFDTLMNNFNQEQKGLSENQENQKNLQKQ